MHFSKLLLLTAYAMASVIPRDEPAGKISEILGSPEGQCALGCAAWFDSCYASTCCQIVACKLGDAEYCEEVRRFCAVQVCAEGDCGCLPQCANLGQTMWQPECKC